MPSSRRPDQSEQADPPAQATSARRRGPLALYPNAYVWFIFVSAMDLFLTTVVLYFGGREVNVLANSVLMAWGLRGLAVFKFAMVVVVIGCCELIGRQRPRTGRWLARFAVGVTAIPVVLALSQLLLANSE
jgi:hypothetical protein